MNTPIQHDGFFYAIGNGDINDGDHYYMHFTRTRPWYLGGDHTVRCVLRAEKNDYMIARDDKNCHKITWSGNPNIVV